ncbi:MAG: DNA-directed RNA polymerase subunit beta [Pirellulales bacterium]
MATPSQRRLSPTSVRKFGSGREQFPIPNLTTLQTASYEAFLQEDISSDKRKNQGLESVFAEIFPIESYDKSVSLEYIRYELGKPRYTPEECRQLRLTYGKPLKVWLRLNREQPLEEEVYLGDIPVMLGGGEFIINGAERVVVSQLHRSPGVDFVEELEGTSDRKVPSCRVIPERGSWIEVNVTKKDSLSVRIDQSGKFSVITLLRAMSPELSTNTELLKAFYEIRNEKISDGRSVPKLEGKIAVDDVVYPSGSENAGEILIESGQKISKNIAETICTSGVKSVMVMDAPKVPYILNSLAEDNTSSHEEALLRIYQRLRPGNPPQLEKARQLFHEKFFDVNRYRLGRVGRFRINRKLNLTVPEDEMTLRPEDLIASIRYLIDLFDTDTEAHYDDIDHLGNRRLRTIDELACEELRKGFLKLRRTVQERMSLKEVEDMTPRSLVNPKSISAAIEYFFGRGELSQVVDQTNPLSQLTHERRLSALGPGGLNRKRAGFEVRDVHISHYGRICPIETPEGTNIGLISSLAIYAGVDEYGFLITPYRIVKEGKISDEVVWLRADEEANAYIAPADTPAEPSGALIPGPGLIARHRSDFQIVLPTQVEYMDIAPSQMIGVSAGLIPFLEHDDANRALMGSNMQRQAVPLLVAEPPIVGTGLEKEVAANSAMVVRARRAGKVTFVDATRIEIGTDIYHLKKYQGLNERTCLNQRPIVSLNDKVEKGQIIADGASTHLGELALGRNVLVGFMSFDGYNYEDAIIISEELVRNDVYTSIHIEEFDVEIRETKLGREEFTRDIPNVSEKALRNLDDNGIVRVGTYVRPGDILVGKVSPKSKTELTPEEKLLHAIFGRAGEDVKNDSLEVSSGVEGIVIDTQRFSRRMSLSEDERKEFEKELKRIETEGNREIAITFSTMIEELEKAIGGKITDDDGTPLSGGQDPKYLAEKAQTFNLSRLLNKLDAGLHAEVRKAYKQFWPAVEEALDIRDRKVNSMKRGDELRSGVLQMVKVYIATKRVISVGDKMAGRHGNKGVISKVLPIEDMPFLPDGTPLQILLNPLGVPSRMNVGQILETHLGWAGALAGFQAITPVFDGATESDINAALAEAGLPAHGKVRLFDGRTGEAMEQETTVGYIYMLKLHHLVDDKVHARSTGPYSLITQQPLGGKARFGGQRFGEMEVWALEAYGAAYILQELLTVKSDDVEGRTKIYESMVKGENTLEAGTPASFDVLTNEIRGLALNMRLEKRRI